MVKDLKIEEFALFKKLDAACDPNSTPIPHSLFEKIGDVEIFAMFCKFLSQSFQRMRDSKGESDWSFDPECILGSKLDENENVGRHHLEKILSKLKSLGLIEKSPESRILILSTFK